MMPLAGLVANAVIAFLAGSWLRISDAALKFYSLLMLARVETPLPQLIWLRLPGRKVAGSSMDLVVRS